VLAGGRYDGLVESLGGKPTPGVGWAAGIERLAMMVDEPEVVRPLVAVIADGEMARGDAIAVLRRLREAGIASEMAFRGNAKRQVEIAMKQSAAALLYVRAPDWEGARLKLAGSAELLDPVLGAVGTEWGGVERGPLK